MKTKLLTFTRNPLRVRGFRRQTTTLLMGLTLMTGTTFVLHAQSPTQAIVRAVCNSVADNPQVEQVFVTADSPSSSVWTPWPVPLFRDRGELCIVAPTTDEQKYFKLVPGTQFYDGFSDAKQPFASRRPYTNNWQEFNEVIAMTNSVLRIARQVPGLSIGLLTRPPEDVIVRDFYASVDILSWTTSSTNWCQFSIPARVRFTPYGGAGYMGALILNRSPGVPGDIECTIWDGSTNQWYGSRFNIGDRPPPYRLEFYGVGAKLTVRVLSLTTKVVIQEMTITDGTYTEGWVGIYTSTADYVPDTYEIIADNLLIIGTK